MKVCCPTHLLSERRRWLVDGCVFAISAGSVRFEEVVLSHLRQIRPNSPFRPWVIDLLGIALVNLARSDRAVLANDVVDDALVRRERVEALLLDLGPSILGGVQEDIVGDAFVVLAICLAGGRSEDADCEAGVAGGCVGDPVELVVGDDVLIEAPLRPRTQNVVQLLVVVLVHSDVLAGAQAAHEAVVDAAEQLRFLVRDADDRELREAVEVVDDAGVFELVDLVEDDDGSRAVVLLEPVDEFVVGRRLPVDVDSRAEVVEDLVERAEPGVVAPAVDVGGLDVEHLLT